MAHERIARLLQTGAPEAFDALLEQYGSEIQTVAYLIVRDRLDAEDILAETLITAWQKGRDLREPAALRTWLLRIATAFRHTSHASAALCVSISRPPKSVEYWARCSWHRGLSGFAATNSEAISIAFR